MNKNNKTEKLERSLTRQLKSVNLHFDEVPPDLEQWQAFLNSVNSAYVGNKETRYILERSLDESSQEMSKLYEDLKQETEQRIKALQESDEKTRFMANMSHEIRTPINGVLGSLEIVKNNTILNKQQKLFVGTAAKSAENLLDIINNILDFSKISSDQLELENINFDIYQLVEDITSIAYVNANDKGIDVSWNIDKAIPARIKGDPTKTRQILSNLLSNAIKFTEKGSVTTRISLLKEDLASCKLRLEVEDTGIGISPEMQQNIFDAFIQEDSSTTRRYGGTGLGLTIIKELTQLMGGQVFVKSNKGQGTTFWADIPFETLVDENIDAFDDSLSGLRILAVDEDKANLSILEHYLTHWNIDVDVTSSAGEGLNYLSNSLAVANPYDIFIVDWFLSDAQGLEFSRAINTQEAFRNIPKIMLNPSSEQLQKIPGITLEKPIRNNMLKDVLLECLHAHGNKHLQRIQKKKTLEANLNTLKKTQMKPRKKDPNTIDVLLAEDNELNALIAVTMMEEMNLTVRHVSDGKQALNAMKIAKFHIVLMDMHMPVMDGYEATQKIREWEREMQKEPITIIALTANALSGDREKCLAEGMNDYVSKPVTQEGLTSVVSRWIDRALLAEA
ncbi:MAG: Histidine kinase [uncultured Thiotrichaceae bacterium]|uniref:histidine kinase n=1 Tax=uncultured Thiotrichaceae bacterium TaxID=298394 RepID=A0A6S6UGR9_9GAMM|nr:MAG: Histidine kinase [uncultured Thiotrichaceae bacterium]